MEEWKQIAWDDFVEGAIGASLLGEYWYCAPKLVVKKKIGEVKSPQTEEGLQLHEEEAQRILKELGPLHKVEKAKTLWDAMQHSLVNLRWSLIKQEVIANGEEAVLFRTIIPELGIIGLPDKADCTKGEHPIIIESKYTEQIREGNRPWPSDELQVAVYMMGLEVLSFKPTHAVIEYIQKTGDERKEFRVELTDALRKKISETAEKVRNILSGEEEPIPPSYPRKCEVCEKEIRNDCDWCLLDHKSND